MIKSIVVRSLEEINKVNPKQPFGIISIGGPDTKTKYPKLWYHASVKLRLEFLDIDRQVFDPGPKLIPLCFNNELAMMVGTFLRECSWQHIELILIHCEVGVSRSPSIAMAITDFYGIDRNVIDWRFNVECKPPNQHVYKLTKEALVHQLKMNT